MLKLICKEGAVKIIIEESLTINIFIIYCILRFTATLTRQKGKYLFLSSLFGGFVACAYPILNISNLVKYILLFCVISLITLTSFKYTNFKKFLTDYLIILLSTFCLGGTCLALQNAVGSYPLYIVALVGGGLFILLAIITRFVRHNNNLKNFTFKLTLKDGDKVVEEEGYLDSGNVLYDNLTNKPIVLVNFEVFQKFYSDVSYFNARLQKINFSSIKNAHYIKINGIGKGTSMLVFTVDELMIEDKYFKNVSLGLSFSGFEKSFGKNILLHCDYV